VALASSLPSTRFQFVSINNCYSDLLPVESGVPQDSILGPLLFIMFMNDLPSSINNSDAFLFADDTKCFRHIKSPPEEQRQRDLILMNFSKAFDKVPHQLCCLS